MKLNKSNLRIRTTREIAFVFGSAPYVVNLFAIFSMGLLAALKVVSFFSNRVFIAGETNVPYFIFVAVTSFALSWALPYSNILLKKESFAKSFKQDSYDNFLSSTDLILNSLLTCFIISLLLSPAWSNIVMILTSAAISLAVTAVLMFDDGRTCTAAELKSFEEYLNSMGESSKTTRKKKIKKTKENKAYYEELTIINSTLDTLYTWTINVNYSSLINLRKLMEEMNDITKFDFQLNKCLPEIILIVNKGENNVTDDDRLAFNRLTSLVDKANARVLKDKNTIDSEVRSAYIDSLEREFE